MPHAKTGTHQPLPESIALVLATVVRGYRSGIGMTQEELATRAQVSVQMVRRLEAGTANPTLGTLHAIAAALGANLVDHLKEVDA